MKMFLDIETTGLIPRGAEWRTDYELFPRIVSVAWKMVSEGVNTKPIYHIVNQGGVPIPEESILIHGIDDELAAKAPWNIQHILLWLVDSATHAKEVIGFNLYFDSAIIKANVIREFGEGSDMDVRARAAFDKDKRVDVMRKLMKHMRGMATMQVCYQAIMKKPLHSGHHAAVDCQAVEELYNESLRLGLWSPVTPVNTTSERI